jgi:hypothetical protein
VSQLLPVDPAPTPESEFQPMEFPPLGIDHPAIGRDCAVCRKPLGPGDICVPVPKTKPTPADLANPGDYITVEAVLVHSLCFQIAAQLVRRQREDAAAAAAEKR